MAYVTVRVLRCLRLELAWAIDKRLQLIILLLFINNKMTVVPLRN